jgi:hypothetical protein
MINKKFILSVSVAALLLPSLVLAQGFAPVTPFAGTSTGTLIQAITNIVNALLTLAAIIAVVFVIIGGVRYITSQGDEDAEAAAKGTILYAVVGLIIIALSAVIVNYIIVIIPAG